jgi:hypothetical protein
MELNLTLDFERLPEYRLLCDALASRRNDKTAGIEMAATHIWMRLWVELGYQAQITNRAGWLSKNAAALFERSLEPMFGDDCRPMNLLVEAGCVTEEILRAPGDPAGASAASGNYFCERFAKANAHLAGNFRSREERGAAASALERNKNKIAHEAQAQAMLLPTEIFKRRDGSAMAQGEVDRSMIMIKTLDNCLKAPGRSKKHYTEGLIADAGQAVSVHQNSELREFYVWLSLNREHPAVPKTAEQILAEFEKYFRLAKGPSGPPNN